MVEGIFDLVVVYGKEATSVFCFEQILNPQLPALISSVEIILLVFSMVIKTYQCRQSSHKTRRNRQSNE